MGVQMKDICEYCGQDPIECEICPFLKEEPEMKKKCVDCWQESDSCDYVCKKNPQQFAAWLEEVRYEESRDMYGGVTLPERMQKMLEV